MPAAMHGKVTIHVIVYQRDVIQLPWVCCCAANTAFCSAHLKKKNGCSLVCKLKPVELQLVPRSLASVVNTSAPALTKPIGQLPDE